MYHAIYSIPCEVSQSENEDAVHRSRGETLTAPDVIFAGATVISFLQGNTT
jgi:hypothetical protein